jgi:acyl dehydratase
MPEVFQNVETITDDMVTEARAIIGQELRVWQYNEYASYDTIRHYAFGIGDDNPLWCDENYGAATKYKTQLAPPLFLCSVFPTTVAPGFTGVHPMKAGDVWTWYRPIRLGDRIKVSAKLVGVEVLEGKNAGRMVRQTGEVIYKTTKNELLARVETQHMRVMRPGAAGGGLSYQAQEQRRYTDEELRRIEHDVFAEERRGATPRWWQDVTIGDEIVPVVKGPLDQITMTCYYAGAIGSPGYKASELKWKQWRQADEAPDTLPNNFEITYFMERVLPSLGHQSDAVARAIGMPGAYDNGHQRMAWLAHSVTNWMGDDGFLRTLSVQIRRPNMFGNTTWCRGRVIEKSVNDLEHCVTLELSAENQDGEINAKGTAVVVLPFRSSDPTPRMLEGRLATP